MNSKGKVLITGFIYVLYLICGTFVFQKIEKEGVLQRCESAKEKAQMFRDDLVSKSFYRFKYHTKVCDGIGRIFNHVPYKIDCMWLCSSFRNITLQQNCYKNCFGATQKVL